MTQNFQDIILCTFYKQASCPVNILSCKLVQAVYNWRTSTQLPEAHQVIDEEQNRNKIIEHYNISNAGFKLADDSL